MVAAKARAKTPDFKFMARYSIRVGPEWWAVPRPLASIDVGKKNQMALANHLMSRHQPEGD
jgi:hypothetical protein